MPWRPNINRSNRVTLAVAAITERFTQADIAQRAGSSKCTVSAIFKEMERQGMIRVCRIGQRGIKMWEKTEKYRAPGAAETEVPAASLPKSRKTYADDRERQAHACLLDLAASMEGWRSEGACA